MLIVDSQVHIWEPNRESRPWDNAIAPHLPEPYTYQKLISDMDRVGVALTVVIPPTLMRFSNDYALEAAAAYPDRLAVIGRFDPAGPNARELLYHWRKQPRMLGVRFVLDYEAGRRWMRENVLDWVWPVAQSAGVPIVLRISHSFDVVRAIAEKHPELKIVVDHIGVNPQSGSMFDNIDEVVLFAKFPNIAVKTSNLPTYSSDEYPFPDLEPHLKRIYDAFGPNRLLWGSDVTSVLRRMPGRCTYEQCLTMFFEGMKFFSESDRERIMGLNTLDWLGWKKFAPP